MACCLRAPRSVVDDDDECVPFVHSQQQASTLSGACAAHHKHHRIFVCGMCLDSHGLCASMVFQRSVRTAVRSNAKTDQR